MEFIQFASKEEAEKYIDGDKVRAGFTSKDNRFYSSVTLSDDACYYEIDAETLHELFQLQTHIEMLSDGGYEMAFGKMKEHVEALDEQYNKTLKAIQFKPLKKHSKVREP